MASRAARKPNASIRVACHLAAETPRGCKNSVIILHVPFGPVSAARENFWGQLLGRGRRRGRPLRGDSQGGREPRRHEPPRARRRAQRSGVGSGGAAEDWLLVVAGGNNAGCRADRAASTADLAIPGGTKGFFINKWSPKEELKHQDGVCFYILPLRI
ncbi:hypothetical protein ZEAMMB73_Zm00001d009502 [Zea mays]|uniref:Uncharacterized protein n=1 Tax=Zea mays TaxID=4577 RepID=A0A1D6FJS4_MAIZE|nr:hypothetical protein ZEAMMB73_Zm00001d009502 [Zea mays]